MEKKLFLSFIGVLLLCWFVSPAFSASEAEELNNWMGSLPEETRVEVDSVIQLNMESWKDEPEKIIPGVNGLMENICDNLKSILTPVQFEQFKGIWKDNTDQSQLRLLTENPLCPTCDNVLAPLNLAWGYLDDAYAHYEDSYCDYMWYPDQVGPFILIAKTRADMAADHAVTLANGSCNCGLIHDCLTDLQMAYDKANLAYSNSGIYCSGNLPWISYLFAARSWLTNAMNALQSCHDEAECS